MEKKSNNALIIFAMIVTLLMTGVSTLQYIKINDLKEIINKTDTITYADTIYLDKVVKDTVPTIQWKKIIERDTIYKKQGDSITATPIIISFQKKKLPIL